MKRNVNSVVTVQHEKGNLWVYRLSGVIRKQDLKAAQASLWKQVGIGSKVRVLALLIDFAGWERNPAAWAEISETDLRGDDVERLAIVGDSQWETEALMFVGAGIRSTRIRFFPSGQESAARGWLETT